MIGSTLDDRYRLESVIGKGGNGTIYRARDIQMDRDVAVKLMKSEGKESPRLRKRFQTEALAAGRIRHPNVITIYDVAVPTGAAEVYMVMELLEGHDLHTEIYEVGMVDPGRALRLFIPCLRALERCHEQGVIHKDLKPSNLFIRERGLPDESMCLLDFGVARLLEGEKITRIGGVAGTPRYMSPEYIRDGVVSPATDVYQMGLILIETLTGQPVIPRGQPEFKIFQRHLEGDLEMPDGFRHGKFGSVIQRATIFDTAVRYENAGEFADALEAIDAVDILLAMGDDTFEPSTGQWAEATTQLPKPSSMPSELSESAAHSEIPKASEVTGWFGAIRAEKQEAMGDAVLSQFRNSSVEREMLQEMADTELQLPLNLRIQAPMSNPLEFGVVPDDVDQTGAAAVLAVEPVLETVEAPAAPVKKSKVLIIMIGLCILLTILILIALGWLFLS